MAEKNNSKGNLGPLGSPKSHLSGRSSGGRRRRGQGKNTIVRQQTKPKIASICHIHKMPVELLVKTFKLFIDGHNSPVIGIILLVCQRWYNIVNTTSSLWSRIVLFPTRTNYKSLAGYVDTAMKKSESRPLDIYMDLSLFEPRYDTPSIDSDSDTASDDKDRKDVLNDLLLQLIGDGGVEVMRWRTYSLHFEDYGSWDLIEGFRALDCRAPLLQELTFHLDNPLEWFIGLHDLSSLRVLILDAPGSRESIRCTPGTLEELHCRLRRSLGIVTPFTNLRHLAIDVSLEADEDDEDDDRGDILLHRLDSLTIRCPVTLTLSEALIERIKVPSLTTLRLIGSRAIALVLDVDDWRKVKHLHCLAMFPENSVIDTLPFSILETVFMCFEALESFTVAPWHMEIAKMALEDSRHYGNQPPSLHAITVLTKDREGGKITGSGSFSRAVTPWKPVDNFTYKAYPIRPLPGDR